MDLSRLIMKLAFRNVPNAREEWARAMQAEFDVLQKGRLAWAIGCLWAGMGWDLKAHALYWLALPAATAAVQFFVSGPLLSWIFDHCPQANAYCAYPSYDTFSLDFLVPCLAFGLWRPGRIVTTAVALALCLFAYEYVFFAIAFAGHAHGYIHIMNMPPVIGETVVMTGALLGVSTGALLRQGGRQIARTLRRV